MATVATSVTGFFLPAEHFLPSHGVGIISLIVLALAIPARYTFHLRGAWRTAYVIGAVMSGFASLNPHISSGMDALS